MNKNNSLKSDYDANPDINYKFLARAKEALLASDIDELNNIGKDMGNITICPGLDLIIMVPTRFGLASLYPTQGGLIQHDFNETDHENGKSYHVDFSPKSAKDLYDNMFGYLDVYIQRPLI
ncbi:MAG: hypothetical protein WAW91_02210 [Candidatus Nanoperiomorbaceae bacterium]